MLTARRASLPFRLGIPSARFTSHPVARPIAALWGSHLEQGMGAHLPRLVFRPSDDVALAWRAAGSAPARRASALVTLSLRARSPWHSSRTPSRATPSHGRLQHCGSYLERGMGAHSPRLVLRPGNDAGLAWRAPSGALRSACQRRALFCYHAQAVWRTYDIPVQSNHLCSYA